MCVCASMRRVIFMASVFHLYMFPVSMYGAVYIQRFLSVIVYRDDEMLSLPVSTSVSSVCSVAFLAAFMERGCLFNGLVAFYTWPNNR